MQIFISTAGTGSHLSLFLPNGGVSLLIVTPDAYDVNRRLCQKMDHILCLNVNGESIPEIGKNWARRNYGIFVSRANYTAGLEIAGRHIDHRCPLRNVHLGN